MLDSATELNGVTDVMPAQNAATGSENNKLRPEDSPIHDWYRFVLSFPPHLVRDYLERFGIDHRHTVLDPFCGTGTTLVECKKLGIPSIGIEPNPMACFASRTKLNWDVDPDGLLDHARHVAHRSLDKFGSARLDLEGLPLFADSNGHATQLKTLPERALSLLLKDSISPLPLHRTLVLLEALTEEKDARFCHHESLALARSLVFGISNLHFGPEVGVGPPKYDAPVVKQWLGSIEKIVRDLRNFREKAGCRSTVHCADSRSIARILEPASVDAVITSPPYPNEKDYTRTTRLESVILGFMRSKQDLQAIKRNLIRSNTRTVYKGDADDRFISDNEEIRRIADAIEQRRIDLGKDSGFERLYARVTKLYFGGMARHLSELRTVLRPGAYLAYVVGDQASYLRVMIRTGQLLADIAQSLGYEVAGVDLFRTRLATATRDQLREEVVVLRWPG